MSHLISEVTAALVPIVATGLVGILGYLARLLVGLYQKHLLFGAVGRAAGLVVASIAANPDLQKMAGGALDAALRKLARDGAAYVQRSYPELLAKIGVEPAHVADMVMGEVGKLLAARGVPMPGFTPAVELVQGEALAAPALPTAEDIATAIAAKLRT